ncbi:toll-like receptor 13 [Gouania willdenowi]|uniref:Toll-like receptor 13 n=1 Tax=Gouania willdenowi TaxID=441366 RepID=A0A8C5GLF6_GOUWI|nr:toll-like receptor 13 [Gouania willdenowi]XP_028289889.1 toll-like receptor 13 [Gouania willdenowi]
MSSRTKKDTNWTRRTKQLKGLGLVCLYILSFVTPVRGYFLKGCRISGGDAKCDKKNLDAVPQDIPPTVESIDLHKNKIPGIRTDDFRGEFPRLTNLNLGNNFIHYIDTGAFSGLIALKTLNLNHNRICNLSENVFLHLNGLAELRITYNCIKKVELNAFKPMTNLKILDLSHNKLNISNVAMMLRHLPNLQKLYLSANALNTFQSWEVTDALVDLQVLDISKNPIKVFNITSDVFPTLTTLSVGSTTVRHNMTWNVSNKTFLNCVKSLDISMISMSLSGIESLMETVNSSLTYLSMDAMKQNLGKLINISCSIPTMTKLVIQKNKLHNIHSDLFTLCTSLTELDLSNNLITTISDDAFRSLPNLLILNLSNNNLSLVPAATRNQSNLRTLDLSHCKISALECSNFANNTKLTQLSLYNNKIQTLKNCVFKNLRKLQVLKLQSNQITTLNSAFIASLPNLTTLHLEENKITTIKSKEFKGLGSLSKLSLQNNQIKTLNKESFFGLMNLKQLQLENNALNAKEVQKGVFSPMINLKTLDLSSNFIKFGKKQSLRVPPFSNLSRLEELSIFNQGGRGHTILPINFLQGLSNLLSFNIRNTLLNDLDKDTFTWTPQLQILDIRSNPLNSLFPDFFIQLRNLTKLYLSNSHFYSLDFLIDINLTKLNYLQAKSNQYSVIRPEVIGSLPALHYADLRDNVFTCDCDNKAFMEWAENSKQTQVYEAHNFQCNYPPSFKGKKLLDFDFRLCLLDVGFIAFVTTTSVTLLLMLVSLTYHFMRWQLVYAYYIFLAWLTDKKHKKKRAPYQYDAFVSYNTHDELWVVQELLPKLEGEQGWKLCLHHRNFEPGKPIIDNITDAIYQSRKTLCVISHKYLESEWCLREFQVASFRLFDEKKDVLILVFLEEIQRSKLSPYYRMRKLLKRQTYLSWPKAAEQTELFWEKLRQALQSGDQSDEGVLLHTTLNAP